MLFLEYEVGIFSHKFSLIVCVHNDWNLSKKFCLIRFNLIYRNVQNSDQSNGKYTFSNKCHIDMNLKAGSPIEFKLRKIIEVRQHININNINT